ncbi:MAG TPA: hypothetical protein PK156_36665 [Polyangium sp.]|nr:hypothetical protein [Polyangium sp.]
MTRMADQQPEKVARARRFHRYCFIFISGLALGCAHKVESPNEEPIRRPVAVEAGPMVTTVAPVAASVGPSSNAAPPPAPRKTPQPGEVGLHYACGEKYESDQCSVGSKDYMQWITAAELKPSAARILSIHEGGPLGAEWNPSNDLVLFAPKVQDPQSVRVGNKVIASAEVTSSGWAAFRVPYREWKRVERKSRKTDGIEGNPENSPVNVVEMELTSGQEPKRRSILLLTAYGE